MSWAEVKAFAEASAREYAQTEEWLAKLTTYKMQVDQYGVWKVKVRRTPGGDATLVTARGGASPRHRGEAVPRSQRIGVN